MSDEQIEKLSIDETPLNPIARLILLGVYNKTNLWSRLFGVPHILQIIWRHLLASLKVNIRIAEDKSYKRNHNPPPPTIVAIGFKASPYEVSFPEPSGINVNMMPFIMARNFKDMFLPEYLSPYFPFIDTALYPEWVEQGEYGKVGYLTIHESFVDKGASQRRPGIHTESPGIIYVRDGLDDGKSKKTSIDKGSGFSEIYPMPVWWGKLGYDSHYCTAGGIYMASSVPESCAVWDCQILPDKDGNEIIGKLGDIEHIRSFLPKSTLMEANKIYWITDRTPHESLPLKEGTHRQFFRLVTHRVSVWYEDHSTKNPLGIVPDPEITRIVKGSKFDDDVVVVVA